MFGGATTPEGIIARIHAEIVRLGGLCEAFNHNGRIQLYSGPHSEYMKFVVGEDITNRDRAIREAAEWNAILLDHTSLGHFVFDDNELYKWLKHVNTNPITLDVDKGKLDEDAKKITMHMSALFIRSAWGEVKTAVCGASRGRVFCQGEIPGLCDRTAYPRAAEFLVAALLDNRDIEVVNATQIGALRNVCVRRGREAVYGRICLGELQGRWRKSYATRSPDAYADYLDRLELYRLDKLLNAAGATVLTILRATYEEMLRRKPELRLERQRKIAAFTAAAAATTRPYAPIPPCSPAARASCSLTP